METAYKLDMEKQSLNTVGPRGKEVLEKALSQVGFIPNMYAYMVNSPGLLDTYLHGYHLLQTSSGFTPSEQEVVFLSISYENNCAYCMAAHTVIADTKSKVPVVVTEAIRNGREIPEPKLKALSEFTRTMVATRGRPSDSDVEAFFAAGYTEKHILEIILAIAVKTLSNYSNHLFHTPLDPIFAGRSWTDPEKR